MSEPRPIDSFIVQHGISLCSIRKNRRPDQRDPELWDAQASHWLCRLTRKPSSGAKARVLTTYYSMGSAHVDPPTVADVLGSLLLDASGIDGDDSFEGWCAQYGYDTDSRKAERTWRACKSIARRLRTFLGPLYDAAQSTEH